MGLFLALFWCASVARTVHRHNSRFGVFNSRLGANKFPFSGQREFEAKRLIRPGFSVAKTALFERNRKNSRFHENNREYRRGALPPPSGYCTAASSASLRF